MEDHRIHAIVNTLRAQRNAALDHVADLNAQLAASDAERLRLQAELDARKAERQPTPECAGVGRDGEVAADA